MDLTIYLVIFVIFLVEIHLRTNNNSPFSPVENIFINDSWKNRTHLKYHNHTWSDNIESINSLQLHRRYHNSLMYFVGDSWCREMYIAVILDLLTKDEMDIASSYAPHSAIVAAHDYIRHPYKCCTSIRYPFCGINIEVCEMPQNDTFYIKQTNTHLAFQFKVIKS